MFSLYDPALLFIYLLQDVRVRYLYIDRIWRYHVVAN
jgi:hypothetical protein